MSHYRMFTKNQIKDIVKEGITGKANVVTVTGDVSIEDILDNVKLGDIIAFDEYAYFVGTKSESMAVLINPDDTGVYYVTYEKTLEGWTVINDYYLSSQDYVDDSINALVKVKQTANIVFPALQVFEDPEIGNKVAKYSKVLTNSEKALIPNMGICNILFNTTCIMIPFIKTQENRFICNAIYDDGGNSMVVRGVINYVDEGDVLNINFDTYFASAIYGEILRPYAVVNFITFE